jgi:hypothetical protein
MNDIRNMEGKMALLELKIDKMERLNRSITDQVEILARICENHGKQLVIIKNALSPVASEMDRRRNAEVLSRYHSMTLLNKKTGEMINIALHDGKEWVWVAPQLDSCMVPFLNNLIDGQINSIDLVYR